MRAKYRSDIFIRDIFIPDGRESRRLGENKAMKENGRECPIQNTSPRASASTFQCYIEGRAIGP